MLTFPKIEKYLGWVVLVGEGVERVYLIPLNLPLEKGEPPRILVLRCEKL